MARREIRRGRWAGLSASTVGKLMGCSHTHARELMKSLTNIYNRPLKLDDIGELIQEYRNKHDLKKYTNRLNNHDFDFM